MLGMLFMPLTEHLCPFDPEGVKGYAIVFTWEEKLLGWLLKMYVLCFLLQVVAGTGGTDELD